MTGGPALPWALGCVGIASASDGVQVMEGVQLLYNNDGENLWAVNSSYHPCTGCAVDKRTIQGSALDVAGVADVDLICPFHNVPWWNSRLEPPAEHRDWYDKTFGFSWGAGGSQLDYVLKGGDFIGDFAEAASSSGQKAFVTFRLNDGQMCMHPPTPDNCTSGSNNDHQFDRLSRFWWDHRNDSALILGLQQYPPTGFQSCCWVPASHGGCQNKCSDAGCEFSWSSAMVRDRIAALVGELSAMYASKSIAGVELDFERGLNYFPDTIPAKIRQSIMLDFVRDIRLRMNAASTEPLALGVRLDPSWIQLRAQGLDQLKQLVAPVSAGGSGVSYINWGVFFYAYQPFDSDIASLVAALPSSTPFYWETTSWIGTGRTANGCPTQPAKVRITKEELWTTALLARSYGAAGISAFNFVYTRPYYDEGCAFTVNKPYSEPLFGALNQTKNVHFLQSRADQLYRLGGTRMGTGQIASQRGKDNPHFRVTVVPPVAPAKYAKTGRLRLLLESAPATACDIHASLNGVSLVPSANRSSMYDEGTQAVLAIYPDQQWRAFEVNTAVVQAGNNSIAVAFRGDCSNGERGYKLSHTGSMGDGQRWRFPYPHTSSTYHGPRVTGESRPGATLLQCEQLCDGDAACKGVYHDMGSTTTTCYLLHQLVVAQTTLTGQSYTKVVWTKFTDVAVTRLEFALPVLNG